MVAVSALPRVDMAFGPFPTPLSFNIMFLHGWCIQFKMWMTRGINTGIINWVYCGRGTNSPWTVVIYTKGKHQYILIPYTVALSGLFQDLCDFVRADYLPALLLCFANNSTTAWPAIYQSFPESGENISFYSYANKINHLLTVWQ